MSFLGGFAGNYFGNYFGAVGIVASVVASPGTSSHYSTSTNLRRFTFDLPTAGELERERRKRSIEVALVVHEDEDPYY